MKNNIKYQFRSYFISICCYGIFILLFFRVTCLSAFSGPEASTPEYDTSSHKFNITSRLHREHSSFDTLPFGETDMGWLFAYEYHEGIGFWQAGAEFSPDPSKNTLIGYVITPQVNLILKDRIYRAGVGVRWSYLESNSPDLKNSWTKPYWQFAIGLEHSIWGQMALGAYCYYVFERWSDLDKFMVGDIEYGISLTYKFY